MKKQVTKPREEQFYSILTVKQFILTITYLFHFCCSLLKTFLLIVAIPFNFYVTRTNKFKNERTSTLNKCVTDTLFSQDKFCQRLCTADIDQYRKYYFKCKGFYIAFICKMSTKKYIFILSEQKSCCSSVCTVRNENHC